MKDENLVQVTVVYEQVLQSVNLEGRDEESVKRLLRNKFKFIMKYILLRPEIEYKQKNKNYIYNNEKALFEALLKEAIIETSLVGKWFNSNLDLSSSETILKLFDDINKSFKLALDGGEVDEVTYDEWIAAIKVVIDYTNAQYVVHLKNQLENLRIASAPLNHEVGLGDIYWENDDGERGYGLKNESDFEEGFGSLSIGTLAKRVHKQKHYYQIISSLVSEFEEQAGAKSREFILHYAYLKCDYESLEDIEGTSKITDLADFPIEYSQMHSKMYEYLKCNPSICEAIENEVGTKNLLEFFKPEAN